MNLKRAILKMTASSIIAFVVCAIAWILGTVNQISYNMSSSGKAISLASPVNDIPNHGGYPASSSQAQSTLKNDFYMLLLGVDSDESRSSGPESRSFQGSFRSDTIMVAHINTTTKHVSLCSLERDIETPMPSSYGKGPYKLNAAYSLGGVDLMKQKAEELIGEKIDYYAIIDMDGLSDIIDSVGGVDVDVEKPFYDSQLGDGISTAGEQNLNGYYSLVYARSRTPWPNGDFDRARHQRDIIKSLVNKIMSSDTIQLYHVADAASQNVSTNLSLSQLMELANDFEGMDSNDIESLMTPTISKTIAGQSFQELDQEKWKTVLSELKQNDGNAYDESETETETNAKSSNASNGSIVEPESHSTASTTIK